MRGSVHWGCYYATALDIEVDPQCRRFGRRESDFALQRLEECRVCLYRNDSDWLRGDGIPLAVKCASVARWPVDKEDAKIRRACGWMCS